MMKQRITVEQLSELSDAQKERLRNWWNPQIGDFILVGHPFITSCEYLVGMFDSQFIKSNRLPLLSIGQMIEFISDNTNDWGMKYMDTSVDYFVYLGWDEEAKPFLQWRDDELVDALWKVIKVLLKDTPTP